YADFWAYGGLTTDVAASIRGRVPPVPFVATVLTLAALAPFDARHRRLAVFYLVIGAVYAVLALGPATHLFSLYVKLPPGGATPPHSHRPFWAAGPPPGEAPCVRLRRRGAEPRPAGGPPARRDRRAPRLDGPLGFHAGRAPHRRARPRVDRRRGRRRGELSQ